MVYSNYFCSCSFEAEIIKNGQSSHEMYSNKILNVQESTTILNACTKKSGNLLKAPRMYSLDHTLFENCKIERQNPQTAASDELTTVRHSKRQRVACCICR